ncbi:hypothetical protein PENSPDRAFT_693260 [Peniophora sp. CONT]|nr:hypothetical protein PENSPDRAFT_693260 [Peniophora sp. CONT]
MPRHDRDFMPTDSREARLQRMMQDEGILREYREHLARLDSSDSTPADRSEAQDIANFSDLARCQSLGIHSSRAPDGPMFFGYETSDGESELVFYDIMFVKHSILPPLPDRRYKNPGTLYHSISLVAPPGSERARATSAALQNMYLCMSTASASRPFSEFSARSWLPSNDHADERELFLTSPAFTRAEDVKTGRTSSKACSIPPTFDTNGVMQRIIDTSRGSVCFTSDNLFRICDLTVSSDAPRSAKFPSADAIVTGQMVYVSFTIRGTAGKPPVPRGGRYTGSSIYSFKPTLRSIFILSKTGPMVMKRNAMLKSNAPNEMQGVEEQLADPVEQDISRDLKRLRIQV